MLSRNADGYFLLVETEEPDSGAHNEDLQRVVRGVKAVNEVAALALEHAAAGDTLILITADHETGGLAILHGDADHNLGVRWATSSHTAEPVPVFAYGPGAERFGGARDNTEMAPAIAELLGFDLFD